MAQLGGTKVPRREDRVTPSTTRSVTSASTSLSIRTNLETTAKITDTDFMESVLEPHGITIQDEDEADQDPITHFGIPKLPRDSKLRLEIYRDKFRLGVWLEPDMEHIHATKPNIKHLL